MTSTSIALENIDESKITCVRKDRFEASETQIEKLEVIYLTYSDSEEFLIQLPEAKCRVITPETGGPRLRYHITDKTPFDNLYEMIKRKTGEENLKPLYTETVEGDQVLTIELDSPQEKRGFSSSVTIKISYILLGNRSSKLIVDLKDLEVADV